jgi:hypothetical protein
MRFSFISRCPKPAPPVVLKSCLQSVERFFFLYLSSRPPHTSHPHRPSLLNGKILQSSSFAMQITTLFLTLATILVGHVNPSIAVGCSPVCYALTGICYTPTCCSTDCCTSDYRLVAAAQIPTSYNLSPIGASAQGFAQVPFGSHCQTSMYVFLQSKSPMKNEHDTLIKSFLRLQSP